MGMLLLLVPPIISSVWGWHQGYKLQGSWGQSMLWLGMISTVLQWPLLVWWVLSDKVMLGVVVYIMINLSLFSLIVLWRWFRDDDDDDDGEPPEPEDPTEPTGSDWDWDQFQWQLWKESKKKDLTPH
jgi:hypothetical protein